MLNPQGIRFGSSEIYSVTEAHPFNEVIETTLCIGRKRRGIDVDESVFLFVVMRPGREISPRLENDLRQAIRKELSGRHVPRSIVQVKEIPQTVNGKKVETLVKEVICTGQPPKRVSATVANPDCLEDFRQFYAYEEPRRQAKL